MKEIYMLSADLVQTFSTKIPLPKKDEILYIFYAVEENIKLYKNS